MHYRDNPKRLFLWREGNRVFAHDDKAEWSRSEIGALVANLGEGYQVANGGEDFLPNAARRLRIIVRNVCPDVFDVLSGEGMKIPVERKRAQAPRRPYDGDLIQAIVYCILVEDQYGQVPPYARINIERKSLDLVAL